MAALFDEIGASATSATEEIREIRRLLISLNAGGPLQERTT
jgi:hypothetical protein